MKLKILSTLPLLLLVSCSVQPDSATGLGHASERQYSRTFVAEGGMIVELENLAGHVVVEGVAGATDVIVEVIVHAAADSAAEADSLVDSLEVSTTEESDRLTVRAVYPVDLHDHYYYPGREPKKGFAHMLGGSRSKLRYGGDRVTVVNRPRRGAIMLYADLRVTLPHGVGVIVDNGVGSVEAEGLRGSVFLSITSGDVFTSSTAGKLEIDSLGGNVHISSHDGSATADTGSGNIEINDIRGDVWADTGSGDVIVNDMDGSVMSADTGSGDISLERVRSSILADTGSGHVRGREVSPSARLICDTGSGDVRMSGDLSRVEEIVLATGSGDVDLELVSEIPSLYLWITSTSGAIDIDLPGLEVIERDRGYVEARLGEAGARTKIKTHSGDISVWAR
jgi:hypothetical protein